MNLEFTPAQLALREEIRTFVAEEYPREFLEKSRNGEEFSREDHMRWMNILARKGWLAAGWPKEYGGPGWNDVERYIFKEELGRAGTIVPFSMGASMCGPVIMKFGTEAQKARFLPPIARAESWWCQGYSEPNAGSDLAGLKTRAERFTDRDGREYYRVNGQKTWTTYAQHADWGFFLVRTDQAAKPQRGISFLLIDMASPGITIRPIETLGGEHEVNEVWLDDVIVPVENRIHGENEGWTCAKYLLEHERSNIAEVARSKHNLAAIADQVTALDDPADHAMFEERILRLEVALAALEFTELRALSDISAGRDPGPLLSMLKTRGSELQQEISELALDVTGMDGCIAKAGVSRHNASRSSHGGHAADRYLNIRKVSIYGGSNEIQRGIIAKHALGL